MLRKSLKSLTDLLIVLQERSFFLKGVEPKHAKNGSEEGDDLSSKFHHFVPAF